MTILLGILLLIAAGASIYFSFKNKEVDEYNDSIRESNQAAREKNKEAGFERFVVKKEREKRNYIPGKSWMYMVGALFMFISNGMFFWAEPTEQYFLVYPTGQTGVVTTQGIKWRGWAKITKWQKFIDIKVVTEGMSEDALADLEGSLKPIHIRFIDQVTADVEVSTRFKLPEDETSFKALAIKFRSMTNLVNNTLIPAVREQVNNTGYMFKAQDYISGSAQSFRQTLDQQLKDGAYAVRKITNVDTIYAGEKSREIKEIKTSYSVEKIEKNGKPVRIPHEITANNIIVSQVIVDDVDLEPTFRKRLEKQRDQAALRQYEKQKTETAKDAQVRIIAEGERDKAAKRVEEEKKQVGVLIAIETELKQEETNKKLAAIQLETERISSEKRKVKADADAYEIRKKVVAGITPEVKLQMELDAKVRVAREISNLKLPQTYISGTGGKGGNSSILMDLLGADYAKKMLNTK